MVLPTGTVTFLLTDVEGSTQRWEADPDETSAVMERHDEILRDATREYGGELPIEQGEGDSVVAVFASAAAALHAALRAQRELLDLGLRVRMALHTGEARLRANRYEGGAIIRTARLRALARGGQIVVSLTTRDLLRDVLPSDTALEPAGEHALKGMDRPEQVFVVAHPDLPSVDLEPQTSASSNVPVALSSLIGRAPELAGVSELLRANRAVTVVGPGGAGKTRLAVELARRQVGRHGDGVWFVDLTAAADLDPAAEVARTLDIGAGGNAAPAAALRAYLAERDLLLVLDNCEHVIERCAELVVSLLQSCPALKVLATSREPLDIIGESLWRLDPLTPADARRLFVERARQRQADFVASEQVDATIAALCVRLDYLPLAIELAAGRVGAMTPAEILAGLDARLDSLGAGARSLPQRQRTIRAVIEWSYALLDADERQALRSLAVFVGGFDAPAAMAVAPGLTRELLARLVDKSIVTVSPADSDRTRYRLLETVREFASDQLRATEEFEAARQRHLEYFSATVEVSPDGWPSRYADRVLAELEDDYGNVLAALEYAVEADPAAGARLLFACRDLFGILGQSDGRRLADALLAQHGEEDRTRVELLITAGLQHMLVADVATARTIHEAAIALSQRLGESRLEGWAQFLCGLAEALGGHPKEARPHLERALDLLRAAGVTIGEGHAEATLGLALFRLGEPEAARDHLEAGLAIQQRADYRWGQGQAHLYLGLVAADDDGLEAEGHFRAAVDALRPYHDLTLLSTALVGQAYVLRRRDPKRAFRIAAAVFSLRERAGGALPPFFRTFADRVRADSEASLGDEATAVWAVGTRLSPDEAIALAFGTTAPRAAPAPSGLSGRELEVVRLVATGLPNKQIAAQLHLSVRTVETHVRNVLTKLALENRTQLARWAQERAT